MWDDPLFNAILIVLIAVFISFSLALLRLYKCNKVYNNMKFEYDRIKGSNKIQAARYSQTILDFIKKFIIQYAVSQSVIFRDTHDISKISKHNIEALAKDVAIKVKVYLNESNILFEDVLFTKEYYDTYIVDTSLSTVKEIFNRIIEDIEEN